MKLKNYLDGVYVVNTRRLGRVADLKEGDVLYKPNKEELEMIVPDNALKEVLSGISAVRIKVLKASGQLGIDVDSAGLHQKALTTLTPSDCIFRPTTGMNYLDAPGDIWANGIGVPVSMDPPKKKRRSREEEILSDNIFTIFINQTYQFSSVQESDLVFLDVKDSFADVERNKINLRAFLDKHGLEFRPVFGRSHIILGDPKELFAILIIFARQFGHNFDTQVESDRFKRFMIGAAKQPNKIQLKVGEVFSGLGEYHYTLRFITS